MKIVAFSQTHLNLGSRPIEWRTLTSNKHLLYQRLRLLLNLDERNEVPENVMARLEWAYLPLLRHWRRKPKVIESADYFPPVR
jgi:hypothetical protein